MMDKIPKCLTCGKEMEMAYDTKLKRKSKYSWKPTCNCFPKDFILARL